MYRARAFFWCFSIHPSLNLNDGTLVVTVVGEMLCGRLLIDSLGRLQFTQPAVIEQAAFLLIAAGAFVFIVSFLGYCGAVKESRILLGLVRVQSASNSSWCPRVDCAIH